MVTLSFSALPFKEYQWLFTENSLEIFVVIGLVLVIIGWSLYRSWRVLEGASVNGLKIPTPRMNESPKDTLEELRNLIQQTPVTDIVQLNTLALRAIQLKTATVINPKVPAREQILPVSAKNILIELERITYAKITTENNLKEFRTRLLKYLI
jgi:hypothetical protein